MFSSIQQTQAVMVYQINHDEVEMNNIPLITVEPLAEVLRSNGKKTLQLNGIAPVINIYLFCTN